MTRRQPVANQLAAIAYPDLTTAQRARDELIQLTRDGRAHLEDAVVVERELGGEVKPHQFKSAAAGGAAAGAHDTGPGLLRVRRAVTRVGGKLALVVDGPPVSELVATSLLARLGDVTARHERPPRCDLGRRPCRASREAATCKDRHARQLEA